MSVEKSNISVEWKEARMKFFHLHEGWGYLTQTKEGPDIFFRIEQVKDAGIIWLPKGRTVYALCMKDRKGLRAIQLSYLKPDEMKKAEKLQCVTASTTATPPETSILPAGESPTPSS